MIYTAPRPGLVTKEQIKYVNNLSIDTRAPIEEKIAHFGYKTEYKDTWDWAGLCENGTKTITLSNNFKQDWPAITSHELGHVIQEQTMLTVFNYTTISEAIKIEQQADMMSLIIAEKLFNTKVEHNTLCYFDESIWDWLKEFYNEYNIQDDLTETLINEFRKKIF